MQINSYWILKHEFPKKKKNQTQQATFSQISLYSSQHHFNICQKPHMYMKSQEMITLCPYTRTPGIQFR